MPGLKYCIEFRLIVISTMEFTQRVKEDNIRNVDDLGMNIRELLSTKVLCINSNTGVPVTQHTMLKTIKQSLFLTAETIISF